MLNGLNIRGQACTPLFFQNGGGVVKIIGGGGV
jgi:hypothetical protein